MDKYLALGRTGDAVINISLNEMYYIHSLICQHMGALVCFASNKAFANQNWKSQFLQWSSCGRLAAEIV